MEKMQEEHKQELMQLYPKTIVEELAVCSEPKKLDTI
jgi:hypothetical protein